MFLQYRALSDLTNSGSHGLNVGSIRAFLRSTPHWGAGAQSGGMVNLSSTLDSVVEIASGSMTGGFRIGVFGG